MSDYDTDFYAWTQQQAAALRQKAFAALDLEHLAEEIESMGKRDRRAVESTLVVRQHDGDASRLRRAQIDLAVADHQGVRGVAAGKRDRPGQMARIGLRHCEGIAPSDGAEIGVDPELLEQAAAQAFALIGANREDRPLRGKIVQRRHSAGKGAALNGDS